MTKAELVFIPLPTAGHMVSMVELAKLLTTRDENLSISILLLKLELDVKAFTYVVESMAAAEVSGIRFIDIPVSESEFSSKSKQGNHNPFSILIKLMEDKKIQVRDAVSGILKSGGLYNSSSTGSRIAGFVLDMFCSSMIDVANEFDAPTYFFYASSAALVALRFHVLSLVDDCNQDMEEYMDSDIQVSVPGYNNPVPVKLWPSSFFDKSGMVHYHTRRFKEARGILVNTFLELEFPVMEVLLSSSRDDKSKDMSIPQVYPVGPIINSKGCDQGDETIMKWLDDQPPRSVIFLCFGSLGSFDGEQVKEIAKAVENSGYKFLWSLRRPSPKGFREYPREYEEDLEDVLPEGFLQRTAGMGKVMGWAPQVQVLSHPAVGGFVSHCGWNSTLESVTSGVPIAAWPLYAEQQMNAFQMVKESGIAVEIKMDYRKDLTVENPVIVKADEIEDGIRKVMETESKIRKKVEELKRKARISLMEGGSSFTSLGSFIEDIFSI